ncbi:MAG: sialidase family protein [Candidatus Hodarchaeota archaeon]
MKKLLGRFRKEKIDLAEEIKATQPDYIVYAPKRMAGDDTGNEHFLVFEGPGDSLMAVWTQSSAEGSRNQRIVFSKSSDEGVTWDKPRVIVSQKSLPASWGFPMVSENGRIYVLYNKHVGLHDTFFHITGLMAGLYSDDAGKSWSESQVIEMPRSIHDNPDSCYPSNWIVWQKPIRLSQGKYFAGFTRWVSEAIRHEPPVNNWSAHESVVEFMRFENIDDDPEPQDIKISYFTSNEDALRVGFPGHNEVSVVQEPSIVSLPDGRLFTVMRTATGNPYYSISGDNGVTWSKPEVLKREDSGPEIQHPISPCPIFQVSESKYIFFYHDHDGHYKNYGPLDTMYHRRPIYISVGNYTKDAHQPIWFSEPRFFMDHTGNGLGPQKRHDLALYSSFTRGILWYPDRKFFLLGRKITGEYLNG